MNDRTMERLKTNTISREWNDILKFLDGNSEDYYFFLDIEKEILCFSEKMRKKVTFIRAERMVCTLEEWEKNIYVKDRPQFREEWMEIKDGVKAEHNLEYRVVNWGGEVIWINSSGKVEKDANGNPSWVFGRISESKLQDRADKFSGAFSMDGFKEELSKILMEQKGGYLFLVGVDNLKSINMKNGWDFGDELLKLIVRYLEEITGAKRVYRVNGDCFAVNILNDSEEEIKKMFSRLQMYLKGKCTLSAGCVPLLKYTVPDVGTLFQYAENSLDCSKSKGKNVLSFFSAEDYKKNLDDLELKEELYRSVKNHFEGFVLYYQPQVYTNTLKLYGAEALLRFKSAVKGRINPGKFIPVLEETGLIHEVGFWVLYTALAQCRKWREFNPDFHISVNMSCMQLMKPEMAESVMKCVTESGVPANNLTIEITESMSMVSDCQVIRILSKWKKFGIRISMDDFGTGYSSLARLRELDVDEIKIDRCFVHEIDKTVYHHHLISNIIELAQSQNIEVCCEGVETIGELAALKELEPTFLQGYLFTQPCVSKQFEQVYFGEIASDFRKRLDKVNSSSLKQLVPKTADVDWLDKELEKNILDNLNDVICLSDMETYELYYLNQAGKRALDVKEYSGKKCYKVLQGKDKPCEFCTNHLLEEDRFYQWERKNEYCGRHYYLKDRLINNNGKKLRLEIAVDITKFKGISDEVKERIRFADRMIEYMRILSKETDWSVLVRNLLKVLGRYYQSDGVYVLEWEKKRSWRIAYKWRYEEPESVRQEVFGLKEQILDKSMEVLKQNQSLIFGEPDGAETADVLLKDLADQYGIFSLIMVPIIKNDEVIGVIELDNPRKQADKEMHIRALANFLSYSVCSDEKKQLSLQQENAEEKSILDMLNVGLWMIRCGNGKKEMFIDDTMRYVMGMQEIGTPEENYAYWYDRICTGYYQYVDNSVQRMVDSWEIVQLEYTWNHPKKGEVVVRCTGIRIPGTQGEICIKGYHRIISDIEQTKSMETDNSKMVFEYNETSKIAFFHYGQDILEGCKGKEENFPQCWVDRQIVHPKYIKSFLRYFTLLRMKDRFEDLEVPLRVSMGKYEWFVMSLRHLSKSEKDIDAVIATVKPFGEYRQLQMRCQKTEMFYQGLLSETVAYAEIDLESGQLTSIGGLWSIYETEYCETEGTFVDFILYKMSGYLTKEKMDSLNMYRSEEGRNAIFAKNELCRRYVYKRMIRDEIHWVELVCHLFREETTNNAYMLMYLRDIDDEKKRERKRIKAAMEDHLTRLLNRYAFEVKVTNYVQADRNRISGALIIFDVDNFKKINDLKGHLAGDLALQRFAEILRTTFSKEDYIGRLGGDEFLVFVKEVQKVTGLTKKIKWVLEKTKQYIGLETSCSAGITLVKSDSFEFKTCLQEADIALYKIKRSGKDGYSYYDNSETNGTVN